jgi:hypothetical protein
MAVAVDSAFWVFLATGGLKWNGHFTPFCYRYIFGGLFPDLFSCLLLPAYFFLPISRRAV